MLLSAYELCMIHLSDRFGPAFLRSLNMAEAGKKVSVELDVVERSWVHVSVLAKREQLLRSRNKELAGSEIWVLRGKEIEALNMLAPKFA